MEPVIGVECEVLALATGAAASCFLPPVRPAAWLSARDWGERWQWEQPQKPPGPVRLAQALRPSPWPGWLPPGGFTCEVGFRFRGQQPPGVSGPIDIPPAGQSPQGETHPSSNPRRRYRRRRHPLLWRLTSSRSKSRGAVGAPRQEDEAGGVLAHLVHHVAQGLELPAPGGHGDLLAVAQQVDQLHQDDLEASGS